MSAFLCRGWESQRAPLQREKRWSRYRTRQRNLTQRPLTSQEGESCLEPHRFKTRGELSLRRSESLYKRVSEHAWSG
jgi:hypothetical protein